MKAPAALPFYLYDFGAIRPDSFLQGDSFKLLEGVQTETVDMVFIDPPYFIKKAEWDTFENQQEYNDFMARAFWEAERILKPNGTLAFWHNDLQQVARLLCWLENWTQFEAEFSEEAMGKPRNREHFAKLVQHYRILHCTGKGRTGHSLEQVGAGAGKAGHEQLRPAA